MTELKGIMKRPNGQQEGIQNGSKTKSSLNGDDKSKAAASAGQLPSLTRGDHPADHNLLVNSLSAKLRKSLSGEPRGRKLVRRSSNGHLFCRTYQAVDPDVYERIRQQQQERKHNEWSRKKQEKLQTRLMSWATEAGKFFPLIGQDGGAGGRADDTGSLELKVKPRFDDYPRGHDNSVVSHSSFLGEDSVRVMKKDGVFRPVNKYAQARNRKGDDIPFSDTLLDYETVTLPLKAQPRDDIDSDLAHRKKVSWSAQGHLVVKGSSSEDTRAERDSKSGSAKSFTSEPANWRRPLFSSGKSKVDRVGIKWKLPLPKRTKPKPVTPSKRANVSKNLTPVTSGLDREGTSLAKIKWQVPSNYSPESAYGVNSTYDIHRSLKTMRHLSFRSGDSSPRKVTFSRSSVDSVCCESC